MKRLLPCLLVVSACSARGSAPHISAIEPDVVAPGTATPVTIHGSGFLNVAHVNLDDNTISVDRGWQVVVGERPASSVTRVDQGTITAVLPADLPPGRHDVVIVSPAGVAATLSAGLAVVAPPDLATACDPPMLAGTVTGPSLGITLSNVHVNGGGNFAHVAPGAKFNLAATWSIQDSGCCVDQIIVGVAPDSPQACLFDAFVPANGASGTTVVVLTAPVVEGTYTVRFHYGQAVSCDLGWWGINGKPTAMEDIAAICVP